MFECLKKPSRNFYARITAMEEGIRGAMFDASLEVEDLVVINETS
jgi:hypothetical protein